MKQLFAFATLVFGTGTAIATTPITWTVSKPVAVTLPSANVGIQVGCYAVNTRVGETLRVQVTPKGFAGEVIVARGARCDSSALQLRKVWKTGETPDEIVMKVPGGRYLVLVNRSVPTATGSFRLSVGTANETVMASAPPGNRIDERVKVVGDQAASGRAENVQLANASTAPVSARKAMMEAQIAQRELELAIAEEKRLQAEELARQRAEAERVAAAERAYEERQARAERRDNGGFLGAIASAAPYVIGALNDASADLARQQQAINAQNRVLQQQLVRQQNLERAQREQQTAAAEAAQARTDEQRRIAQLKLAAAQEQARIARQQQQSMQGNGATGGGNRTVVGLGGSATDGIGSTAPARPTAPAAEIITMMEGVVVCPLNPDRAKLFGESTCYGPFQNGLSDPGKAYDMQNMCGINSGSVRDLGTYGNNRVWGCNYGVNPRKSGSPNVDQAARFNLIIPARRTFRCDAKIDGYCRSQ